MLCQISDLNDPGSLASEAVIDGETYPIMVVRHGDEVRAYRNSCPHVGTPLDFAPGRFLNVEKTHIICATHGALFQIDNGLCVSGPCVGKSLKNLNIIVDYDNNIITLAPN